MGFSIDAALVRLAEEKRFAADRGHDDQRID
jgi:hypothetical protein